MERDRPLGCADGGCLGGGGFLPRKTLARCDPALARQNCHGPIPTRTTVAQSRFHAQPTPSTCRGCSWCNRLIATLIRREPGVKVFYQSHTITLVMSLCATLNFSSTQSITVRGKGATRVSRWSLVWHMLTESFLSSL